MTTHKTVPREPTQAMIETGENANKIAPQIFEGSLATVADLWRVMYDAAPDAPAALTFAEFRAANVARCIKWHPAGIESWSPSDWLTAVTGELGELASLLKMRNRERDGLPGNKFSPTDKQVADEIADVLTYLDLLAAVLHVDLGAAAVSKFNEVSERVGFPDRLRAGLAAARRSTARAEPTCAELRPGCIGFTNGCHCPGCMGQAAPAPDADTALVERMPQRAEGEGYLAYAKRVASLCAERYDDIERLTRERDDVRAMLQNTNHDAARLAAMADKYKWQVRDTCKRAETVESALAAARAENGRMRAVIAAADMLRDATVTSYNVYLHRNNYDTARAALAQGDKT